MLRIKTKSVWGNPPNRLYRLVMLANNLWVNKYTVCIVGCSDGKFMFPFARKGIRVVGYDVDTIALYGGEKLFPVDIDPDCIGNSQLKKYAIQNNRIMGAKKRIEIEGLEEYIKIEVKDYYNSSIKEHFDIVLTSGSIHYSINQEKSLEVKVKHLQKAVQSGGLLYIDYMMAIDEYDELSYPLNKFFRKGEMRSYFGEEWVISYCIERNKPVLEKAHVDCLEDHYHRFGYILARKR